MADAHPLTRRVSLAYRRAEHTGAAERETLEAELRRALNGRLGADYRERQLSHNDRGEKAFVDDVELEAPGVFLAIHELDPRRRLTFIERSDQARPRAERLTRAVPELEDHIGSVAYLLVLRNHVAVIESAAMRTLGLATYLSALLQAAGQLAPDEEWRLRPKVQASAAEWRRERGITGLAIKPDARMAGSAASRLPVDSRRRTPPRRAEERMARGDTVLELLRALGASRSALEDWREHMSTDLGIEAKLVISVRKNSRSTDASLSKADIAEAIASLEENNAVRLISPDGNEQGTLTTLKTHTEILCRDDGLEPRAVAASLAAALQSWHARGAINLLGD